MSTAITGTYFDGETLDGRPVQLMAANGRIQSTEPPALIDVALEELGVSDRLGDIPRFLYLPGGRTITTPDNDAVDQLLSHRRQGRLVALIHALEGRYQVAAAATVLLVASVALTVWWGLPVLARRAALAVPGSIEEKAGQVSLATLQRFLAPSQLNRGDRGRVQAQADRLVKAAALAQPPKLVFLSMGGQSPNAFALPGGNIIMSDELVRLAEYDEELAAVLAHEIGHWQHRHGIQSVLRSSTSLLVVSTVTGDLSTLTTFAGTIPFLLLQRGYSREFEAEADAYALDLLRRANIDPRHFRSILRKLDASRPKQGNDLTYLSTHPGTEARVKALGNLPGDAPIGTKAKEAVAASASHSSRPQIKTYLTGAGPVEAGVIMPHSLPDNPLNLPPEVESGRLKGRVVVEFVVDEQGRTQEPRIVHSDYKEFEASTLAAIRAWRFEPARKNGRAVSFRASQTFEFSHPLLLPGKEADRRQP
jgi:TonB family protein